ncbi:hypothetical protein, partial [Pseudomonas syringae group genomosp. 7]|uniref:hypothetical protein n=1 Tax=Pseudomonas syringae group genomosp. 7 TaxID=251699 RepID=UPI00377024F6
MSVVRGGSVVGVVACRGFVVVVVFVVVVLVGCAVVCGVWCGVRLSVRVGVEVAIGDIGQAVEVDVLS